MSYLLCRQCNGYYELTPTESPHDFENCCCGGPLRYIKSMTRFSKRIQSESEEDKLETDNTVVIYNHLKNFKESLGISSSYNLYLNDEVYPELGYETSTEYYETEAYVESPHKKITIPDFSELMPKFKKQNNQTIPDLGELISDYYDSTADYYEGMEQDTSNNQFEYYDDIEHINLPQEDLEYLKNEYYDLYSKNNLLYSSKRYLSNHWSTIIAFGILPLEYLYLFGNMPLNVIASFSVAVPIIMSYLPRTAEIQMDEDVKRVCNVWVIYVVIFVLILLTWAMLNLVKMPLIYI